MSPPDFAAIEAVFRAVNRVVWIVTAAHGERRSGLLATWVSQCSIDPEAPLALIGLAPNHFTAELVTASKAFCLHLFDSDQLELAWKFGLSSGRSTDKFAGLRTMTAVTGAPLIADCLAWLDCRVLDVYDGGDRMYYWGEVVAGRRELSGQPATEADLMSVASREQKAVLQTNMISDRNLHRPLRASWRRRLGR
jgi:flavin reductase (DIM6/NTAB) family NADH-FMN oxidoreductase RutF